jgi:hypothetical protein
LTGADSFGRDEFSDLVVEFALGQLTGRERAAMLAHLEDCMNCRLELQDLTGVVDELLLLTPAMHPPAGFEDRVSGRLSVHHRRQRRFRALAVGVAVVTLAAVGFGVWRAAAPAGSTHPGTGSAPTVSSSGVARAVVLLVNGADRGDVVILSGRPDWMFVSVRGTGWTRVVSCVINLTRGGTITAGTFVVRSGSASWGTAMPIPLEQVHSVILTDAYGSVLAEATLATSSDVRRRTTRADQIGSGAKGLLTGR